MLVIHFTPNQTHNHHIQIINRLTETNFFYYSSWIFLFHSVNIFIIPNEREKFWIWILCRENMDLLFLAKTNSSHLKCFRSHLLWTGLRGKKSIYYLLNIIALRNVFIYYCVQTLFTIHHVLMAVFPFAVFIGIT